MISKLLRKSCLIIALWVPFCTFADTTSNLPQVGTHETLGRLNNVEIEVMVQSPSGQLTPLQIICAFEYTEGDIFNSPPALPKELNGMVHVDDAFHGLITQLRKSNQFGGRLLETLLITPSANTIPAQKLLLIGLGNRKDFKPEMMRLVGLVGMRAALSLGISSYSHASDLKDAGFDSPVAEVAGNVVLGAIEAYNTQSFLNGQNASPPPSVSKITLLSGPSFFADSKAGITKALPTLTK